MREKKRRQTHQRIVAAATTLVTEHGFDNVTVEQICEAAGISRRTFFNYMDSKDAAVLGTFPLRVTEASLRKIETTQADNVLGLVLESVEINPEGLSRERITQLRTLVADNPSLQTAALARKREAMGAVHRAVDKHFAAFPADRTLDGADETTIIVELFQMAATKYLWDAHLLADAPVAEGLRATAAEITQYAKELKW